MRDFEVKIIRPEIKPYFGIYGTPGSAAMDLAACVPGKFPIRVGPGEAKLINTGIAIHIADPGICGLIFPRSGLGHNQGLVLGNGTGVIDSDYQGEIKVSICNRSQFAKEICHGDRIAQMMFVPVIQGRFDIVDQFTDDSIRGSGGFGSTGV